MDFVGQPQLFSNTSLQVEKQSEWVGGDSRELATGMGEITINNDDTEGCCLCPVFAV